MYIEVKVVVKPTEDENKVKTALENVFDYEKLEYKYNDETYLVATSTKIESLKKLSEKVKKERKELSVRSLLLRSIENNQIKFKLNKQAAYMKKLSFSTVEEETPLGAIEFRIFAENLKDVIDYIAPLPKTQTSKVKKS
jgi:predicted RNA binding protein with dsRBD fold (UPF0201 family)